jgi:membrane protein YdbS with pleckstrin-like domain
MTALSKHNDVFQMFLVILMLLLVWPIGVILMWTYAPWPKAVKAALTLLCAVLTVVVTTSVCYLQILPA